MFDYFAVPQFIFVAINFVVLFLVLRKLLFGPVTKFMEERTRNIKSQIENADNTRKDAERLHQEYSDKLTAAADEAKRILDEARARAFREHDSIIDQAKKEADAVKARATEDIASERAAALRGVRDQVASLALAAASRVLEANMDNAANRVLVDKFIDEEGVA